MKRYSKYLITTFIILTSLILVCFIPVRVSSLIPQLEKQIASDLGVDVHLDKLILRLGASIKLKTPMMHVMYDDGRKFAQFDNIKFYINVFSLLKNEPVVTKITAKKVIIKVASDDESLMSVFDKINSKSFKDLPNLQFKTYNLTYHNKKTSENYCFEGHNFELDKIEQYKNFKLKSEGTFSVNTKKYLSYDVTLTPNLEFTNIGKLPDITELVSQITELDFHSDIITDMKLYRNAEGLLQASGFLNIDNISVLDPTQKNPKSFVYLTLWGDKASILSNIYTSNDKKVYLEGMLNNSKKPILDLKVKTDDINLQDLFKKVKLLTGFSIFKDIKSLSGSLNANFTLKGDLNKIKSTGYLNLSDVNLKTGNLNLEKINADINLDNNVINIVNAIGYANNAPIMLKGKVGKTLDLELLMSKVDLKYLCPDTYGIKQGIVSLVANINGTLQNITHKENLQIYDLKIDNKGVLLNLTSLKYDTNKNNTAYLTDLSINTQYAETVKIPTIKLLFEGENISIPKTDIFMPNSKITTWADITNYKQSNAGFNLVVDGYINSGDLKFSSLTPTRYPIKTVINGTKLVQNVNSQVVFEKPAVLDEPALANLTAKLDKGVLKIDDLSLYSFSGKFSDDLKLNTKGQKKIVISGAVDVFEQFMLKNIRIFLPQQLNLHINDTIAQLKGDVFINGSVKKPDIIGQISIPNLFNQQMQLAMSNCVLDFNKNNIAINAPLVKIGDSSISFTGNALTDISRNLTLKNINIKSKYLNTDTLLMYKDLPICKVLPLEIKDGKLYSERTFVNIYGSPIYLTSLSADFALSNDLLLMRNISSEMFNGKLGGSLDFDMKEEHFSTNLMARNVSAEPIFNIISLRKDTISGTMDFDSKLTGSLSAKSSLIGDVKFIINNGRMSSLGKLEHLLYAQNVVADNMLRTSLSVVTKAITLKDTGLFKYLRGDISLVDGIANIKLLQSQGPLMALFIKGQYNPENDYAKLVVLGRLSDEIISGLGAFGDFSLNKLMIMLTGEDHKYNVLTEDFEKIPQLPMKNTKEFRSIINGVVDKPSSVLLFNWISYSEKSFKQKDVPQNKVALPDFINNLPY